MLLMLAQGYVLRGCFADSPGLTSLNSPSVFSESRAIHPRSALVSADSPEGREVQVASQVVEADARAEPKGVGGLALVRVFLVSADSGSPILRGMVQAVEYSSRRIVKSVEVDEEGAAFFPLPFGRFAFTVKPNSLPDGMIPPPLQDKHYSVYWDGLHSPTVEIKDSTPTTSVSIPIQHAAEITGYVTGEGGRPLSGAMVRVSCDRKNIPSVTQDIGTDPTGFYRVLVAPGEYRLQPTHSGRGHFEGVPLPWPAFVTLAPAERITRDFSMTKGPCSITGILMDPALVPGEDDVFWNDLQVLARAYDEGAEASPGRFGIAHAMTIGFSRTDINGVFQISGLHQGTYQLSFAPWDTGYDPYKRDGLLAHHPEQLVVNLDRPGVVDIGETLAARTRLCDVAGRIVSDLEFPSVLEMQVTYPEIYGHKIFSKKVRVGLDGSFAFWVYASPNATPAIVRVRRSSSPKWEVVEEVEVPPYSHQVLELHYP